MKSPSPQEEQARQQARSCIKEIVSLQKAYYKRIHSDREGSIAVLDEADALLYDTDISEPGFVSFLLAGGGPDVRLRVQRIGVAPGPALLEARHWGIEWFRVPMGRNQRAAAHWFACHQHPFTRSI